MKKQLKKLLLISSGFIGAILPICADELLYVGLTDTGWQVFRRSITTGDELQLTRSHGDKRTPVYSELLKAVVFKGPKGKIWSVNESGEETVLVDIEGCGDFTIDGSEIYFTRLVTGNPQRQQLWKAEGEYPTKEMKLVFRPENGSLRQVQYRSGRFLATHIWKVREEQIVVIDLEEKPPMRYLSARKTIASYPRWIDDRQVVYSQSNEKGNYDLYTLDADSISNVSNSNVEKLTDTVEYSEFASTFLVGEQTFFSERLNEEGQWSIVRIDRKTGKSGTLDIERQAKEPSLIVSE